MLKTKIQSYFGNLSLRRRLITYFYIICIIPILLIGSISIIVSLQSAHSSFIKHSDSTLIQITSRIDYIMDQAESTSYQLANDPIIKNTLIYNDKDNHTLATETIRSLNTYLNYVLFYSEEIDGLYIINNLNEKFKSNNYSFIRTDFTTSSWYQDLIHNKKAVWFPYEDSSKVANAGYSGFISYGEPIINDKTKLALGIIIVDIRLSEIEKILREYSDDLGQMIIVDSENHIIASANNSYDKDSETITLALELSESDSTTSFNQTNNAIIASRVLGRNNWRIISILPWTHIYKDSIITVIFLISLVVLISFLAYFFSRIITSTITTPVNHMIDKMKEVESGNLDVSAKVYYDDEIGRLGDSFNMMTLELNRLMKRVVEEQQNLRKAELKTLQSQINPHFLYNTLDSVVWLARMKEHDSIVEVVNAMSTLFRISLSRGKDIITIEEEIDHIQSYLKIQKFRYRTHFDYYIDIPPPIMNNHTIKLLLQPLVENAIYHGIKLKREGGTIRITASEDQENIVFKVIDTGLGMTSEILNGIHESFETNSVTNIPMYGIKNVQDRIKIYYGNNYGLRYESQLGVGTTAIITIPIQKGDELYVKNSNY